MAITLLRLAPEPAPPGNPEADLRQLHRMALTEMARLQEEMERLAMPDAAVEKYRDAMLLAFEDYRQRHRSDRVLSPPVAEPPSPLDMAPIQSPAMRRFLGF